MATAGDHHFFEGTEKLLEVWFSSTDEESKPDLRSIDRYDICFCLFSSSAEFIIFFDASYVFVVVVVTNFITDRLNY